MKKILFLLLLAIASYGQTVPADATPLENIQITNNVQNDTLTKVGMFTQDGVLDYMPSSNLPVSTATQTALDLKANRESGIITFDGLAINADPTKFNLGAGTGYITNSLTGVTTPVNWASQTAQTTPYLATSVATYVLKDSSGVTVLQNSYPTNEQFRTHIYLGKLAHTTFTTISFVVNDPSRSFSIAGDFHDFVNSIGSINIEGNAITPNGANLNINVSAGRTYREGANFLTNRNSPNITTEPAVVATSFRNKFRNGSGGWSAVNTTTLDPNYYDDGSGILQLVPNNKFTVKVVYRFGGTGTIHMDYGQVVYDDMDSADAGIANSVASDPDTKGFASRIGWIIIKQGTTSLLTSGNYKFVAADMFGVRAATSAPVPTLQAAYNGSVTPQITTTTGGGAVAIRRGSAADTDTIITGQNGAGTTTSSVKGNGEIYTAATPTSTAFSHYHGQTASDGIIRPKTLANVRTEIVTTAAVDAAKANIVTGTGTTNTLIKWGSSSTGVNSNLSDNGALVSSSTDMSVNGVLVGRSSGTTTSNVRLSSNGLSLNTTGVRNSSFGDGALQSNTTGSDNVGFASNALRRNTDGSNNVAIGSGAGDLTTTSQNVTNISNSILIGRDVRVLNASGDSNCIAIGSGSSSLGSNTSVIGNGSTTFGRWWGNLLVGTSTNNGNAGRFAGTVDVNKLQLNNTPATASGTPPLLTWNSTTKDVESVPYSTFGSGSFVDLTTNQTKTANLTIKGATVANFKMIGNNTTAFQYFNDSGNLMTSLRNAGAAQGHFQFGTTSAYIEGRESGPQYLKSSITFEAPAFIATNGAIRLKSYTVATLPAGTQGDTAFVTDATAPTYLGTLTGGGSVVCPVFYNGTAWVSH